MLCPSTGGSTAFFIFIVLPLAAALYIMLQIVLRSGDDIMKAAAMDQERLERQKQVLTRITTAISFSLLTRWVWFSAGLHRRRRPRQPGSAWRRHHSARVCAATSAHRTPPLRADRRRRIQTSRSSVGGRGGVARSLACLRDCLLVHRVLASHRLRANCTEPRPRAEHAVVRAGVCVAVAMSVILPAMLAAGLRRTSSSCRG